MQMVKSLPTNLLAIVLFLSFIISSNTANATGDHDLHQAWLLPAATTTSRSTTCRGTIAECLAGEEDEEEFLLDSEINRRILAATRYISYGALSKNYIPCSRRGASYYNCRPGAQANPYRRGCSVITRCRQG
ncbi:hypothetical protein Ancab_030576 [Ancistrocladus abbreviatus]